MIVTTQYNILDVIESVGRGAAGVIRQWEGQGVHAGAADLVGLPAASLLRRQAAEDGRAQATPADAEEQAV